MKVRTHKRLVQHRFTTKQLFIVIIIIKLYRIIKHFIFSIFNNIIKKEMLVKIKNYCKKTKQELESLPESYQMNQYEHWFEHHCCFQ
jgi:hypothetical protein